MQPTGDLRATSIRGFSRETVELGSRPSGSLSCKILYSLLPFHLKHFIKVRVKDM